MPVRMGRGIARARRADRPIEPASCTTGRSPVVCFAGPALAGWDASPGARLRNHPLTRSGAPSMPALAKSAGLVLAVLALSLPAARADEPARPGALVIVGGGTMPD